MKFFEKSLIFFSCIGLSYFSIEAKSISVLFENSTSENYSLEALVSDPLPYCQKIIVENQGTKAVHGCLPTSNGEEYLSLDHLAQLLAKEKQPLLTLFKLWQKVLPCDQSQRAKWSNPSALDYLNHIGSCPISEYQKQFIQLCHQLGIDTRQANIKGKTVYDFNCQGDEWSLLDVISGQFYLGWDNKTLISSEAMMDDPLLVLRTKPLHSSDQMDFAKAWQNFAQLELIDPSNNQ